MKDWYECVEEPLRDLVRLLRNNGFNTTGSCGHLPKPYVEMKWDTMDDPLRLYNLLVENGYKNFSIEAFWWHTGRMQDTKGIELKFHVKSPLVRLPDIREIVGKKRR